MSVFPVSDANYICVVKAASRTSASRCLLWVRGCLPTPSGGSGPRCWWTFPCWRPGCSCTGPRHAVPRLHAAARRRRPHGGALRHLHGRDQRTEAQGRPRLLHRYRQKITLTSKSAHIIFYSQKIEKNISGSKERENRNNRSPRSTTAAILLSTTPSRTLLRPNDERLPYQATRPTS